VLTLLVGLWKGQAVSPGVVVLGAGPAGLGAALQLARRKIAPVTVLEQAHAVGGLAGSFLLEGIRVDYGSHRLHPACDPSILRDLRELLGGDLLLRPRRGRIRLHGRWIRFPLSPLDLLAHLPPSFSIGAAWDLACKPFAPPPATGATFESVLRSGLGATICRDFYFPYARKLWGVEPAMLSPELARRRISGNSPGKLLRKVANAIPGLKAPEAGKFCYPRNGYGQISDRLAEALGEAGGDLILDARVTCIEKAGGAWRVLYQRAGEPCAIACNHVWSTLPVGALPALMAAGPPAEVLAAAAALSFRAMILIYLVLEQPRFTVFDAHYFPEDTVPLTRLSEPKNYSAATDPPGLTALCAELPCDLNSSLWTKSDEELGDAVLGWLAAVDLPVVARVRRVVTRRLPRVYPVYNRGYEAQFRIVDDWLASLPGLLTFGRQGLFAHDNLHHALFMGYSAAACLHPDGAFDLARWAECRKTFESHVVAD